jgi:hypothetical protein
MNLNKTLAALAVAMLAGLAAPMATADHDGLNCPASHMNLASNVEQERLDLVNPEVWLITDGVEAGDDLLFDTKDPDGSANPETTTSEEVTYTIYGYVDSPAAECVTIGGGNLGVDFEFTAAHAGFDAYLVKVERTPGLSGAEEAYSIKFVPA